MTDYTPTGKPDDLTRYDARAIRREFDLIAAGISSKSDLNSDSTVSTTSMLIESPATKTFTAETGKDFAPGQTVYMADAANPAANNMAGVLTSYAKDTTGIMIVSVTSHNGSGTKSDWAIGVSNQSGVTLGTNTFTGAQNFARATVASHATTADIWGAAGNQIDFTGIATVTDFPAAPQAGASRDLICAAGCSFTAGANMQIDGITSGNTVTCSANDTVIVRAVTLTQFRLTIFKYSGLTYRGAKKLILNTVQGRGSVNTKALRFLTVTTNTGASEWTYADSATLGGSVTILNAGLYTIGFAMGPLGNISSGVSRNSNQLTTVFDSITETNKLFILSTHSNGGSSILWGSNAMTVFCDVGDVIVAHLGAGIVSATGESMTARFYVERLL